MRAILLAQRGRNREERLRNYEAARQILLTRLSQSNEAGQDVDRMLLAGIYEQEWMLRDDLADTSSLLAIRDVMRPLVDRANPPVEYLIQVIEFCFRHLKDISTVSDEAARDDLREVLTSDAELRIGELASAVAEKRAKDQQFLPIAYQSRLLALQHREEEAQRMISEFAEAQLPLLKEDADRAKFYLQLGNLYASIGNHRQAEKSYRHLVTVAPNGYVLLAQSLFQQDRIGEAVDVCLEANDGKPSAQTATVLAQLLSSREADVESSQRADDLIQAALKADGKNVDLLMSVAVQMVTRDNSAEAIRLFRKVIEIDPDHMLALNNLATLLAEEPNQLAEARNYIERAIAVAGRTPSLLDTFGTILARSKKYAEATAVLEEAVAGVAMDPRYHFHLAVAYQGAGRDDDARSALETSREKGLEDAILTSGDREMLRSLEHGLSATSAAN